MTKLAASEARYTTAPASSDGCAQRPSALFDAYAASQAGSARICVVSGVSTTPGRDRVHPHPARPELGGGRAQQLHEPGLGRRVDPLPGLDRDGADRGETDDRAATALGHRPAERAHQVERGAQVQVHHAVELVVGVVQQPLAHVGGRGEHQHVDAAELGSLPCGRRPGRGRRARTACRPPSRRPPRRRGRRTRPPRPVPRAPGLPHVRSRSPPRRRRPAGRPAGTAGRSPLVLLDRCDRRFGAQTAGLAVRAARR